MDIRGIVKLPVVGLIAALSACDELADFLSIGQMASISREVPQLEGLTGEISIGLDLPLTGRLALTDLSMKYASELALNEINSGQRGDARIKFVPEDDRRTVERAIEAYHKLIAELPSAHPVTDIREVSSLILDSQICAVLSYS